MATLWIIILLGAALYGFWYQRKLAETAQQHAEHQASTLGVQLVSVACTKRRFGVLKNKQIGVKTEFMFEFSSDGETLYQGTLFMENTRLVSAFIPPHRI